MVQQKPKAKTKRTVNKKFSKPQAELVARSENQQLYIDYLKSESQIIVCGPAGTGKTYIAATHAANQYSVGAIDKIVITRPHVAVGKDIGYLPGTLEEKSTPWAMPVLDVLERHLGKGVVETAIKNGNIEMCPLALIRGRTFDNSFIILDEAQNLTIPEVKALLTRVGEGSQVVLDGDIQQSDIKEQSGLAKVIHLAKKHNIPAPVIEFEVDDIVRSDICKMWIEVFLKEGL